jgi:hypothetical protein
MRIIPNLLRLLAPQQAFGLTAVSAVNTGIGDDIASNQGYEESLE